MPAHWDDSDGKTVPCPHAVTIRSRAVSAVQAVDIGKEVMNAPGSTGSFWFGRSGTGRESAFDPAPITFHFSDENTAFWFKMRFA